MCHLQVGDVVVDVHGGGLAVLSDVFVILWARLLVHPVHTRDGNVLVATGNVPAGKNGNWGRNQQITVKKRGKMVKFPSKYEQKW